MIPKVIHYIWLGRGKKGELAERCINSWKRNLPDFEIVEWNEDNFDINSCEFVKEAYENKQYAFASDYIRLFVLYNYGGIYMDTDVEVIKDISKFLQYRAFSGFESEHTAPTGIMAAERNLPIFKELLFYYEGRHFLQKEGKMDTITNVVIMTEIFKRHGLVLNNKMQTICDFTFFPSDYFCPKDVKTLQLNITSNTYTIHHFDGSWLSNKKKIRRKIMARVRCVLGKRLTEILENLEDNIRYGWKNKKV